MFKLALLTALVASGASALQMVTPASLVQCQPVLLSWNSGTAPYYPSVLPGNQPSAAALVTFPQTNDESMTWIVNLPAGTAVSLAVTDGTGAQQWASVLTVQKGSSDSCLNSTASVGAGSGAAATGSSGATAVASGSSTAPTASGASETPSASGTKVATTSSTPTSGAGAVRVAGSLVAAGVIAAIAL